MRNSSPFWHKTTYKNVDFIVASTLDDIRKLICPDEVDFTFIIETTRSRKEEDKIYEYFGMARGTTESDFIFEDLEHSQHRAFSIGPVPQPSPMAPIAHIKHDLGLYHRIMPEVKIAIISTWSFLVHCENDIQIHMDIIDLMKNELVAILGD